MDSPNELAGPARPDSRTWSESSRRSEHLQEVKEASEELRKIAKERAKVAADMKKLQAEKIMTAAEITKRQADVEAELEMLDADSQHARRLLDVISETFGSEDGAGSWEGEQRDIHSAEAAGQTSQWTARQTPAAGDPWVQNGGGDAADAGTTAAIEAARGAAASGGSDTRSAAMVAARDERRDAEASAAVAPGSAAAGAAAALPGHCTSSGAASGAASGASEEMVNKVCQLFSMAASKPHFNKDLPAFTGEPLQFMAFKAIFYQSTEVMHLNEAQNLLRLQTALKGRAREAVAGLLLCPSNVEGIMKTLEALFGNPNTVIQRTLGEIKRIKELSESLESEDLMRFACQIKNFVATVKAVKRIEHLFNPDLLATLVSKLPRNLLTLWLNDTGRREDGEPVLIYFASWLENLAIRAQNAGVGLGESAKRNNAGHRDRKFKESNSKGYVFNTQSMPAQKCPHCSGTHYLSKCEEFRNLPIDGRWEAAKALRRCFKCLGYNHGRRNCSAYKKFPKSKYHFLLTNGSAAAKNDEGAAPGNGDSAIVTNTVEQNGVLLQVLPIQILGPHGRQRAVHALLDAGSTVSMIDRQLAEEMGIRGPKQPLQVSGIGQMKISKDVEAVSFRIRGEMGSRAFDIRAYSVPELRLPVLRSALNTRQVPDKAITSFETTAVRPQMLIGADYWQLIVSRGLKTVNDEISLSRTHLGWVAIGRAGGGGQTGMHHSFCLSASKEHVLDDLLAENLRLEQDWPGKARVLPDVHRAAKMLEETTSLTRGVWTTGLLWKDDTREMPDSKGLALARLRSVERQMDKDNVFGEEYNKQINRYLAEKYAVPVDPCELRGRRGIFYLPHMGVKHPAKPGKIRVVHDAAASVAGVSLNSRLIAGPDYCNSIIGILFRFRENAIAFTADIRDMYLRIKVTEADSFSQLFLWRGFERNSDPRVYRMTSLIFGSKSSSASAQYVRNVNAARFAKQYPDAARIIENDFYVDDLLSGASTVEEATRLIREINEISISGNFTLAGWASNARRALAGVHECERSSAPISLEKSGMTTHRLLGLSWTPESDTLGFNLSMAKLDGALKAGQRVPTKREVLQMTMAVWDPLGALSPVMIRAKIAMQKVWARGTAWDEPVTGEIFERWCKWLEALHLVRNVQIPRYHGPAPGGQVRQLHIFCDASEEAMCAVAYIRVTGEKDAPAISFIASKTRVAPLKNKLTIPRLELTAALLGAELASKIEKEHTVRFQKRYFWTDSTNVLWWIRSTSANHMQFVANRLGVIDELSSRDEWHWVEGRANAADDGTRASTVVDLSSGGRWFAGPQFLQENEETWPEVKPSEPNASEMASLEFKQVTVLALNPIKDSLIDLCRFSQHKRLVRAVAYVFRFAALCRKEPCESGLTAKDVAVAESWLIRDAQLHSFGQEIDSIRAGKSLSKSSSLAGFNAYVDDLGIVRLGGRIENAKNVSFDVKNPIILHAKGRYALLLMKRAHEEAAHGGVELTLSVLRGKYWLIAGRAGVKRLIHDCVQCKIRRSRPVRALMGQLPASRLTQNVRPFATTGADMFGPLRITVRRSIEKRYGLLFTCFSTRATHIELAGDLSTSSTIMAIRRFVARRGKPHLIVSDNAMGFRSANDELKRAVAAIDNEAIRNRLSGELIEWRFSPPSPPITVGFGNL